MFSNFLIGLREGLEASLVVGILVAYLVKTGNRARLAPIWLGVAMAVGISLGFGAVLQFTSQNLSFKAQETFGGVMSIVAVALVTTMVFWMRRTSHRMSVELGGKLDAALAVGPWALAVTACIAVGREGLETALFLWANVDAAERTMTPLIGGFGGIAVAVVLGWLIYRRAVKINLVRFFRWTGAALVVIAAGVLAYGVHDLQEANLIGGLNAVAYDISGWYDVSAWYGALLKGVFNFSPRPSVAEAIVYLAYLLPVMTLFLRRADRAGAKPASRTIHLSDSDSGASADQAAVLVTPAVSQPVVPAPLMGSASHRFRSTT